MNNKNTTLFDLSHTHTDTDTQKSAWANSFGWHFKHFATHICNTFWWSFSNSFASNFPYLYLTRSPSFSSSLPSLAIILSTQPFSRAAAAASRNSVFAGSTPSPLRVTHNLCKSLLPFLRSPPLRKSCHFSSFYALLCFLFSVLASPFWQSASVARVVVIRVVVVVVAGRGPLWLFLSPNFASIFHILLHFLLALAAHTK